VSAPQPWMPVLVVRSDGSVGPRRGEAPAAAGLVVVADCPACREPVEGTRQAHRRWQIQTTVGYRVGDLRPTSRQNAHTAAVALGNLSIDWTNPTLAFAASANIRQALSALARPGLTRAAAKRRSSADYKLCDGRAK
jgi:hypothetical protein